MSRRSFAKASLLATALGLAALGSTLTPAAARLPSLPAKTAPGASLHPGIVHLPTGAPVAPGASLHPGIIHLPTGAPVAPGASLHPGNAHVLPGEVAQIPPGASTKPGKLKEPLPLPPVAGGNGIDNICPFNPSKCPPKGPAGSGTPSNPPSGSGSTYPSGGPSYPSGGAGPVAVLAPQPVFQAPQPVYQPPSHVVTATSAAPTATEPCNCLTKQYLDDGSVLFRDICTKEAAMATPDQLRAQAQGAAPTVR
jgi:hypothetical protein